MNYVIAYELLATELATYRDLGFEQLTKLVGERSNHRKHASNGVEYEIDISVRWYNDGDIRVVGTIRETAWGGPHDYLDDSCVVRRV